MSITESRHETDEKFSAYHRSRDRRLRDELVEQHVRLARLLASRFRNGSEPFDELVQVACIGLMKAVARYNLDYGTSFNTFATPTILGELKRHLRDRTWSLHVSRRDKDLSLEVRVATEEVQQRVHCSEPSARQIAVHAGLTEADAKRGQRALTLYNSTPLDPSTVAGQVGGKTTTSSGPRRAPSSATSSPRCRASTETSFAPTTSKAEPKPTSPTNWAVAKCS
jgi:RNA polymerase sigma-B factor